MDYALDLQYEEVIQRDLLEHLLPVMLQAWSDDLRRGDREYGGFVENFYPALVRMTTGVLSPSQRDAVSAFMRATIIDEVDEQTGLAYEGMGARPYRWIRALTTHGVIFPDMDELWSTWWSHSTPGRATASVQYLSCLIYGEEGNPVFAPWTRDAGGGPPTLWELAGHLYGRHWLPENVAFLRKALTPAAAMAALTAAVQRLAGRPEEAVAARVQEDAGSRIDVLRRRCAELPELLETQHEAGDLLEWSR